MLLKSFKRFRKAFVERRPEDILNYPSLVTYTFTFQIVSEYFLTRLLINNHTLIPRGKKTASIITELENIHIDIRQRP
jgi:hypothetical protein